MNFCKFGKVIISRDTKDLSSIQAWRKNKECTKPPKISSNFSLRERFANYEEYMENFPKMSIKYESFQIKIPRLKDYLTNKKYWIEKKKKRGTKDIPRVLLFKKNGIAYPGMKNQVHSLENCNTIHGHISKLHKSAPEKTVALNALCNNATQTMIDITSPKAAKGRCFGTKESNVPYGIHPMFKSLSVQQNDAKPVTPLNDRVINTEAMVLGFAADHSLPFSLVPKLIGLSKTLAKDKKVLDQLSMNRTTAAYKMRFGLGKTFQNELIEIMRTSYFSLNLDESTSNNYQKVLTILVSYYCPKLKEITVRHFKSLSFVQVNAQSLFDGIVKLFDENNIPFKNLVSMLMDSCNVMRGSKTGLEVRIRSKAPHLLDIDGDSCHHAHNACKAFCKPFEGFAEHLMSDIFNDYKWSTDQRQALEEICGILNIKYTMPQNYVPHRWLSVYDVILDLQRMLDAHTIIYFTWLSQFPSTMNDKAKYLPLTVEILHRNGVQEPARERIWEIRKIACKSDFLLSQSQNGKARKLRMVEKLFMERRYLKLIIGLYSSVLPLLKSYVMMFEMKESLIHNLHEEQVRFFKEFIGCYIKPEVINSAKSSLHLKDLDIKTDKNLLKPDEMFLGTKAKQIIDTGRKDVEIKDFLEKVCCEFKPVLGFKCSIRQKYLLRLQSLVTNILAGDEEKEHYELQVRRYQTDDSIPLLPDDCRIDHWWANEKHAKIYPLLVKMVQAILTCFHGPQVESSFSVMNDIIDGKSNRMNIETYNFIQSVKYSLKSSGKSAIQYFTKDDILHERVDHKLVQNMQSSSRQYQEEVKCKKLEKEEKLSQLQVKAKKKTF
ncbi:unnamed protein product [Mytilus coruscus]|uniref:HAT C-terminal dimerisation domain-containing protein n=1 Tax=Mytilus coruscus TaxID=42192 RepID=A0A6J8C471_MYTCO|nr:unnamed protein product [Mytilus coruscus]